MLSSAPYVTQRLCRLVFATLAAIIFSDLATADTSPPEVSIVFPGAVSATEKETLLIRGTAKDESGILSLKLTVSSRDKNNQFVQTSVEQITTTNNFQDWQAKVKLRPGYNLITVTATDGKGNTIESSDPTRVERINPGADWTEQPRFNAGISDFDITPDGKVAYALTFGRPIARIDLETGSSTYAFRPYFPYEGEVSTGLRTLTLDPSRNLLYTATAEGQIYAIDIASGTASTLTTISFDQTLATDKREDSTNAEGIRRIKYDPVHDQLLILVNLNGGEIYTVDLKQESKKAALLVPGTTESDAGFIHSAVKFTFDFSLRKNLIYVRDFAVDQIIEIDLADGSRQVFLSDGSIKGLEDITLDPTDNTLVALTKAGLLIKYNRDTGYSIRYIDTIENSEHRVRSRSMVLIREDATYLSLSKGSYGRPEEIFRLQYETEPPAQVSQLKTPLMFFILNMVYDTDNQQAIIYHRINIPTAEAAILALDTERAAPHILADSSYLPDSLHLSGAPVKGQLYFLSFGPSRTHFFTMDIQQRSRPRETSRLINISLFPFSLTSNEQGEAELVFVDLYSSEKLYRYNLEQLGIVDIVQFFDPELTPGNKPSIYGVAAAEDYVYLATSDQNLYVQRGRGSPRYLGSSLLPHLPHKMQKDKLNGVLYLHNDGSFGCGFYRATPQEAHIPVLKTPSEYCYGPQLFTARDAQDRLLIASDTRQTLFFLDMVTGEQVILFRHLR